MALFDGDCATHCLQGFGKQGFVSELVRHGFLHSHTLPQPVDDLCTCLCQEPVKVVSVLLVGQVILWPRHRQNLKRAVLLD